MGLYIPDLRLPADGDFELWIAVGKDGSFTYNVRGGWRDGKQKVFMVPPHGRLIDADALHKLFEDQWHYLQVLDWNENPTAEAKQSGVNWCINTMHDSAPTVIPASKEG